MNEKSQSINSPPYIEFTERNLLTMRCYQVSGILYYKKDFINVDKIKVPLSVILGMENKKIFVSEWFAFNQINSDY